MQNFPFLSLKQFRQSSSFLFFLKKLLVPLRPSADRCDDLGGAYMTTPIRLFPACQHSAEIEIFFLFCFFIGRRHLVCEVMNGMDSGVCFVSPLAL